MKNFADSRKKHDGAVFIGLSHLGLVTSLSWASLNPPVIGIDTNSRIIKEMQKGRLLVLEGENKLHEPGLERLLDRVRKNYYPTTDFSKIKNSKLVFFAQDTPKDNAGSQKTLVNLVERAIPYLRKGATIVIMSQVPVGFCRALQEKIQKKRPYLAFHFYHWVDILVMTNAIERFTHPERIIIGSDDPSRPLPPILRAGLKLFSCPIFNISYESAELTKAAINLYLATSVTFANTLSDFCEAFGADLNEIIPALQSDKRIGPYAYLRPTLRIAGGHLERDLAMLKRLAKKKKVSAGVVDFVWSTNASRYRWVQKKLREHLFPKIKKPTICIWGLSYKKNTTSTHNAASVEIIKSLKNKAKLQVYDPMAALPKEVKGYTRFKDKYGALRGADCLLILTDWDEFAKVDVPSLKRLMRHNLIIDSTGMLHKKKDRFNDFTYLEMGVG